MATEEDVAAGLINWVNSLEVADPVSTIDDLTDGSVIWKVLRKSLRDRVITGLTGYRTDRCIELPREPARRHHPRLRVLDPQMDQPQAHQRCLVHVPGRRLRPKAAPQQRRP